MSFFSKKELKDRFLRAVGSQDYNGMLSAGLESLAHTVRDKPVDFQLFLEVTGEKIDEIALKEAGTCGVVYKGGELRMQLLSDEEIEMEADLFFQSSTGDWSKHKVRNRVNTSRFDEWDSAPELIQLAERQTLRFPLYPPNT